MKRSSLALVAAVVLGVAGRSRSLQGQPKPTPSPVISRSDEMLQVWNDIGKKLVVMAEDFPEDKYDFKLQKDQRTFALVILHVAAADFDLIRSVAGTNVGPDFGNAGHNPTRDMYKTKADVVKLIQQAVAAGADVIKQQGDSGLDKTIKYGWGNRMVHGSYSWMAAIEHSAEHYGQLVAYYRANNLVPPASRR